jgi:ribosomal protein S10
MLSMLPPSRPPFHLRPSRLTSFFHLYRLQTSTTPTDPTNEPRLPRSVQALYLTPLRREVEYGVPSADLQLRSYSKRGLELYCDFALRAAYYLGLPAFGPVPLPRITERWTVPKSSFIFKKSQENFERITMRRLIQIRDGNPETVQIWLAFLQKHAYPGVGMKANMWEFEKLGMSLPPALNILLDVITTHTNHLFRRWQGHGYCGQRGRGPAGDPVVPSGPHDQGCGSAGEERDRDARRGGPADQGGAHHVASEVFRR